MLCLNFPGKVSDVTHGVIRCSFSSLYSISFFLTRFHNAFNSIIAVINPNTENSRILLGRVGLKLSIVENKHTLSW